MWEGGGGSANSPNEATFPSPSRRHRGVKGGSTATARGTSVVGGEQTKMRRMENGNEDGKIEIVTICPICDYEISLKMAKVQERTFLYVPIVEQITYKSLKT